MNTIFKSSIAGDLNGFLQFKRSLQFRYARAEFTLREFDRFLVANANKRLPLDQAALKWLSEKPGRKPVSVSGDAAILRQLFAFCVGHQVQVIANHAGRSCRPNRYSCPTSFPRRDVLETARAMCRLESNPLFHLPPYMGHCCLSCTARSIRFGEALRLRIRDVNTRSAVLFIDTFKGRARWVELPIPLSREARPLSDRAGRVRTSCFRMPGCCWYQQDDSRQSTAAGTLRGLFQLAGETCKKGESDHGPTIFGTPLRSAVEPVVQAGRGPAHSIAVAVHTWAVWTS